MIIKLLIIISIVIVGAIILFPKNLDFFSNDFDETKDELTGFKDEAINNIEETLGNVVNEVTSSFDNTADKFGNELSDLNSKEIISAHGMLKKDESIYYGQVFEKNKSKKTCQVSVPDMAQIINGQKELTHIISIEDCKFDVNDSVQIISRNSERNSGSSSSSSISNLFNSNPNSESTDSNESIIDLIPNNLIFDTLSLSTIRYQNNSSIFNAQPMLGDVQIQYEDTSGRTNSVTVTLKNSEKELFSGIFYTSRFATSVNNIDDSPHILEMVVEHADHGRITSSVFNPTGNFDNRINGIFVKPN